MWQESVVLLWLDQESGDGGFQRIGQLPNQGTTNHWNGLMTTDGTHYIRDLHGIPLEEADRASDALGSGGQRITFEPGGGKVDFIDENTELHLVFEDFYPMCEVWRRGSGGHAATERVTHQRLAKAPRRLTVGQPGGEMAPSPVAREPARARRHTGDGDVQGLAGSIARFS